MIRVPLTQSVSPAGQLAPSRSAGEGTQTLSAFDSLAQTVGNAGQNIFDSSVKLKRIENERRVNELKAGMRRTEAEFQNSILNDHDPETWQTRHKAAFDSYLGSAGVNSLPPEAKEMFDDWSGEWRGSQELQVKRDAAIKVIRRAEAHTRNQLAENKATGNWDANEELIKNSTLFSPEEKQANLLANQQWRKESEKAAQMEAFEANAKTDPLAARQLLSEGKYGEMTELEQANANDFIRSRSRQVFAQWVDEANNAIVSGEVKTASGLRERWPKLAPAELERLEINLSQRQQRADLAALHTPHALAARKAKIALLINDLQGAEDFDAARAALSEEMSLLPKDSMKEYFQRKVDQIDSGRTAIIKTRSEAAMTAMEDAHRLVIEKFKPKTSEMTLTQAVDNGLLKSEEKLWKLFGMEGAGEDKFDLGMGFRNENGTINDLLQANRDAKNANEQMANFRTAYSGLSAEQKKKGLARLAPIDRAVVLSIAEGNTGTKKVSVPVEQSLTERMDYLNEVSRQTKERESLVMWLAQNKDADDPAIHSKMREITGSDILIRRREKSKETPRGNGGEYVPGETTFSAPEKLEPLKQTFIDEGVRYGIDPRFLLAISIFETGRGTSSAFRNKNNAMGVSDSSGAISFTDSSSSIAKMARGLASSAGYYKNAHTISDIAEIYAPPGAANDPNGTNIYWGNEVSKIYKQLGGDPETPVK